MAEVRGTVRALQGSLLVRARAACACTAVALVALAVDAARGALDPAVVVAALAVAVLALGVMLAILRAATHRIRAAVEAAQRITAGELGTPVEARGTDDLADLARALNETAEKLQFTELMQIARDEEEAYTVLRRHVEHAIPAAEVVVLNRNNSADQLEAVTPVDDDGAVATGLLDASPDSCMAIRQGGPHARTAGGRTLLACEICGASKRSSTCVPSLVAGEVIGAVLVEHDGRLDRRRTEQLGAIVGEAAPAIARLRGLAVAERRAATDMLTGLPNSRALADTLKRMAAHAGRMVSPLAAVMVDLDHFKEINDLYGHAKGDETLAHVAQALRSTLRASDFAARYGGEEFVVLLPDTSRESAVHVAEKLRAAVASVRLAGVGRPITASFGIAEIPRDAGDGDTLLRVADRALYAAKANGRDRVETVSAIVDEELPSVGTE